MKHKVHRSFQQPSRGFLSFNERWRGSDKGLITSYEIGKALRLKRPDLVKKVMAGELPALGWKGGQDKEIKIKKKYGSLHYLAQWQALRGENLNINPNEEVTKECSRTGITITYTSDISKLADENVVTDFIAIDFETATEKRASICQVGITRVENGKIVASFSRLVKPPNNNYSEWNTRIHGISAEETVDAPLFPEVWKEIKEDFEINLVVAHNIAFDRDCLNQTLDYYDLPKPRLETECTYLLSNHKLNEVCQALDIELKDHHNAEADSKACAEIYLKLLANIEPDYSKVTYKQTSMFDVKGHERLSGDILKPDLEHADRNKPFYGKKVVFTGALKSIERKTAAAIIYSHGADIDTGITKRTDYVITGSAPGPSKLKKIEAYNLKGCSIKIIYEDEFLELIKSEL